MVVKIWQLQAQETSRGPIWANYFYTCMYHYCTVMHLTDWLCWGLTTRKSLWVILCQLPEKGKNEIDEIVEEMKERDREERGKGMKLKKHKK